MTDLVTIEYSLLIRDRNEASGDEPRLEFYFFTGLGGELQVTTVDSGILAEDLAAWHDPGQPRLRNLHVHAPIAPTAANPFLGFAARAYEVDDNYASDTAGPMDALVEALRISIGPTVTASRTPTVSEIWLAVNGGSGVPGDDRTGVSARMFRSLGSEVVRDGTRRSYVPQGSQANDAFSFGSEGAHWEMEFQVFHQSFR